MKNHTKVYLNHFDYTGQEFIACECCGARAVDIHHIKSRGMGGVKDKRLDIIENLQALCRKCHDKYGDSPEWLEFLIKQHAKTLMMKFQTVWDKIMSL